MAAPTVTSVTPSTGSYLGGTTVLVVGTGFTTATGVTIGGDAADFEISGATLLAATTPAGIAGTAQVIVTNPDGSSTDVVNFTYSGSGLFSVAEARTYDKAQLGNASTYTSATIIAKEAAIRARFEDIIGVYFSATSVTEYIDGDGTATLYLGHHNPFKERTPRSVTLTSVTVISTDDTETAFTATELANVVKYPDKLVRRSGTFTSGHRNIKCVYTVGYATVPDDIKQAALQVLLMSPPDGLVPVNVSSYATDGQDGQINWSKVKDESRGRYYGNNTVDEVLREHRSRETLPGIS